MTISEQSERGYEHSTANEIIKQIKHYMQNSDKFEEKPGFKMQIYDGREIKYAITLQHWGKYRFDATIYEKGKGKESFSINNPNGLMSRLEIKNISNLRCKYPILEEIIKSKEVV